MPPASSGRQHGGGGGGGKPHTGAPHKQLATVRPARTASAGASFKSNGGALAGAKRSRQQYEASSDDDEGEDEEEAAAARFAMADDSEGGDATESGDEAASAEEDEEEDYDGPTGFSEPSDDEDEGDEGEEGEELAEVDDFDADVHLNRGAVVAVEYEKPKGIGAGSAALPWARATTTNSKSGVIELSEAGFGGLEEIPSGSYELVKNPGGGFSIVMKTSAATVVDKKNEKKEEGEKKPVVDKAAAKAAPAPSSSAPAAPPAAPKGAHAKAAPNAHATHSALTPAAIASSPWGGLNLHPLLHAALARLGFAAPTPVQAEAIPPAITHFKDVIGAAATGSGKTLAYALPILHRCLDRRERLGMGLVKDPSSPGAAKPKRWAALPALVLCPTRELAQQVRDHLVAVAHGTAVRVAAVVGGLSLVAQARVLAARPDVIVATPGRFWDLVRSGEPYLQALHRLQFLVLDEADRLCEKGHFAALDGIFKALRPPAGEGGSGAAPVPVDEEAERIIKKLAEKAAAKGGAAEVPAQKKKDSAPATAAATGEGEAVDAAEEAAAAAGLADFAEGEAVVPVPSHYKRQTFLFSATLGLQTPQTAKDAAAALIAAHKAEHGDDMTKRAWKRLQRSATERAATMTPVEALMARVGLLGKPVVLRVGVQAAVADAAAAAVSRVVAGTSASLAAAAAAAEAAPAPGPTVALPAGLRLGRITCTKDSKDAALCYLLSRYPGKTLVFVNAISTLRRVVAFLTALRLPVTSLHAHMQQRQRFGHLERFRADPAGILVATDVAARGLDIPAVGTVIQYSLPHTPESFVHRCGRTARASTAGLALSLVGPEDAQAYIKLLGVLQMPEGLPEFPMDAAFLRKLHHRTSLARRVADLSLAIDKESAQGFWLATAAKAAGIEVQDAFDEEDWGGDDDDEEGAARPPPAKRRKVTAPVDHSGHVEGEDGPAPEAQWLKAQRRELASLRAQLDGVLAQSVAPAGMSSRYVTANPLLNQAAHPMQAQIRVEPLAAVAGGGAGEGEAAVAAPAAAAARPATSGSALVAPRIVLPGVLAAPPPAKKKGKVGVHHSRPGMGRIITDGSGALAALEARGKHVYTAAAAKVLGRKEGGGPKRKEGGGSNSEGSSGLKKKKF